MLCKCRLTTAPCYPPPMTHFRGDSPGCTGGTALRVLESVATFAVRYSVAHRDVKHTHKGTPLEKAIWGALYLSLSGSPCAPQQDLTCHRHLTRKSRFPPHVPCHTALWNLGSLGQTSGCGRRENSSAVQHSVQCLSYSRRLSALCSEVPSRVKGPGGHSHLRAPQATSLRRCHRGLCGNLHPGKPWIREAWGTI